MTLEEQAQIRKEITRLKQEITDWSRIYRQIENDLKAVDNEIMSRHRAMWALEKMITPTKILPIRKPSQPKVKDLEILDIDKLTPSQLEGILELLRSKLTGEEGEEE